MATVYVHQFKPWEESTNDRQCLVAYVVALGASDEESSLAERGLIGVGEGEVGHVVERLGEDAHRYAKLERRAWLTPHQVRQ